MIPQKYPEPEAPASSTPEPCQKPKHPSHNPIQAAINLVDSWYELTVVLTSHGQFQVSFVIDEDAPCFATLQVVPDFVHQQ